MAESDRRTFLKQGALLGGGLVLGGLYGGAVEGKVSKSKIVISRDEGLRKGGEEASADRIGSLLDRGMEALFGGPADEVWRSLAGPRDTVGLKVNCLSGKQMSTGSALVWAIVARLERVGVKRNRIVIWDRMNSHLKRAGYEINVGGRDVQCYGTDAVGYHHRLIGYREVGSLFSRILVNQCSKIVNLPVLKDHGICGVTLGMKNFFGAIHNPNKYHDHAGDPYIADLNVLPMIREKTVLTVVDGITAQYEGGPPYMPQWTWDFNGLLLGLDPVALDYTGWQIIERKRAKKGRPALKEASPVRAPTYIATAADANHRIGTNDPNRMDVVTV